MACLSPCCYPPVLSSRALAVSKQHLVAFTQHLSFPHPHRAFFLIFFFFVPFSHWGMLTFWTDKRNSGSDCEREETAGQSRTWDHVACVHLQHRLFLSVPWPHFFLLLSTRPSLSSLTLSPSATSSYVIGFYFHYCYYYCHSEVCLSLIRFLTLPVSPLSAVLVVLVCVNLFPLLYVVRAPAVDYQSVDSQRAAKASSTNTRQYPNDWLVGCGAWKPPYLPEPGSVHRSAHKAY